MKYKIALVLLFLIAGKIKALSSNDTVNLFLPRAYTELVSENMYSLTQWIIGDCITDNSEVGGYNPDDIPDYQQLMLFNVGPCNMYMEDYWFRAYNIIFHANKVIDCLPRTSFTEAEKKQYTAEAKFVRALAYFELTRIFGGVPIITSDDKDWGAGSYNYDYVITYVFKTERSSLSDVYTFIENELKTAVSDLPAKSAIGENKYKATKGAGNALLSKIYLYESSFAKNYSGDTRFTGLSQKWTDALSYAEQVINSGEYSLVGNSGETYNTTWDSSYLYKDATTGFRYIFSKEGNYSNESVLEAERLNKEPGWESFSNNAICMFSICRFLDCSPISNLGWGFNKPSDDLINAFKKETGTAKDDPRYIVTIGTDSDSAYINSNGDDKWCHMDFSNSNLKSACRKFEVPSADLINGWYMSPINPKVIRYSDVILMAAEAALESGDNAKALTYINMVRTRARNCGTTGHPVDLTSVTHADIELERRLELALEGHRFFDLVRWNKAESTLNGKINKSFNKAVVFTKGVNEFFPLPSSAMFNSPLLAQNNGYEDFCAFLNKPADRNILISVKSLYVSMTQQYSGNSKSGAVLTVSSSVPSFGTVSFKNDTIWINPNNPKNGDSTIIKLHLAYSGKTKDTSFMVKAYKPSYILDSKTLRLYKSYSWACYAQTDTIMAKYGITSSHTGAAIFGENGLPVYIYSSLSYNSKLKNSVLSITFPKNDVANYIKQSGIKDSIDLLIIAKGNKSVVPVILEAKFKTTDLIAIVKYPTVDVTSNNNFTVPVYITNIDTVTYNIDYDYELNKYPLGRDYQVNEVDVNLQYDKNQFEYSDCSFEGTIISGQNNIKKEVIPSEDNTTDLLKITFDGPLSGEGKLVNLLFKSKITGKSSIDIDYVGLIKNYTYYNKDSLKYVKGYSGDWGALILNTSDITNSIDNGFQFDKSISIFPNPAKEFFMLNNSSPVSVSIYDMYGRVVLQKLVQAGTRVDVSTIHSGIYIIQVTTENKTIGFKLLKK